VFHIICQKFAVDILIVNRRGIVLFDDSTVTFMDERMQGVYEMASYYRALSIHWETSSQSKFHLHG